MCKKVHIREGKGGLLRAPPKILAAPLALCCRYTYRLTACTICIGFHDDENNNTFGYFKKGVYMPQSNFLFDFLSEVVCESSPQSSGFLIDVKVEGSATSW